MSSKIRSNKELLQIAIDHFYIYYDEYYFAGLCRYIELLYTTHLINYNETQILDHYIHTHKPDNARTRRGRDFWWEPHSTYFRITFLKKLLNNLNNQ